jgi:hypothetical protein
MNRTIRSLGAALAATAALSVITLAATSTPSAGPARAAGAASAASTIDHWQNWGGYVAVAPAGKKITGVSTSFIVPKVVPKHSVGSPRPYEVAMWAGLDGSPYGGYTGVEQAGVWVKAASKTATPTYQLFWEMFPAGPQFIPGSVKPGDQVIVIVTAPRSGNKFHFRLIVQRGAAYYAVYDRTGYAYKSALATDQHSAEVITEVPTTLVGSGAGLHAVEAGALNTGTVHYTDSSYSLQGDAPVTGAHSVTQHKISARYRYFLSPFVEAWIIPTDSSASSPSYGTAWKTDSFKTNFSYRGW